LSPGPGLFPDFKKVKTHYGSNVKLIDFEKLTVPRKGFNGIPPCCQMVNDEIQDCCLQSRIAIKKEERPSSPSGDENTYESR
jgi:hypothetical protein